MAESVKIEPGKIFVGGLSWDTTKDNLIKYFENFGEVTDGVIMVDSVTKMPRGFGFVTFRESTSVQLVMKQDKHSLDGKKIDPKEAITKDQHATSQMNKNSSIEKKVFVGGLPHGCTSEEIKVYFQNYGLVTDVDVKMDKGTSKPRGFAFVEYDSTTAASKAIAKQFQTFKDKKIEVKAAENRIPGGSQPSQSHYQTNQYTSSQYAQTAPSQSSTAYGYPGGYYYPYPGFQANQTGYTPTHATPQQSSYPSQSSSFPANGYQQTYPTPMYPSQSLSSTAYPQHGYSTPTGYPQGYTGTYTAPNDTTPVQPYGQSQTNGNYYQTTYSQGAYQNDTRYSQAPPSQRNW